jgi:hypothetical protein
MLFTLKTRLEELIAWKARTLLFAERGLGEGKGGRVECRLRIGKGRAGCLVSFLMGSRT